MFIHDIIKIKYIQEGYLQDHPYSMISDSDMFEAFTKDGGYFDSFYPCPDSSLQDAYNVIKSDLYSRIEAYKTEGVSLGKWVYSYMLGAAIGPMSDEIDIEYINKLLGTDSSLVTEYNKDTADAVYEVSQDWLKKMSAKYDDRVPTIFGEPYVLKSLRLASVDVLGG